METDISLIDYCTFTEIIVEITKGELSNQQYYNGQVDKPLVLVVTCHYLYFSRSGYLQMIRLFLMSNMKKQVLAKNNQIQFKAPLFFKTRVGKYLCKLQVLTWITELLQAAAIVLSPNRLIFVVITTSTYSLPGLIAVEMHIGS